MLRDVLLITDDRGRRFLARLDDSDMVEISGLGTFRNDLLRRALEEGELAIGEMALSVRPASVTDIISQIERRAQIITPKDIASILLLCDIRCGSSVVEGGAGSGALTIALLSAVGDNGSVSSYEIKDDFAKVASRNVKIAGLADRWTLRNQDICKGIEERELDAVVVDIPSPWECVGTASDALRIGGAFCAFVPSANQVEKTVRALRDDRFSEISAIETLQREMVVHDRGIRPSFDMLGHTGYLVFARRGRVDRQE